MRTLKAAGVLFSPRGDPADDGAYRGRLALLIDSRTASAAEQFAAMLKDAGAATLFGEKTLGAGCGYTDGGVNIVLPNSGVRARMPDCLRLRKDGSNEVLGVAPDVAVPPGRADALLRALGTWVADKK
jgi:C-terminal processing protease CtpA/Prc